MLIKPRLSLKSYSQLFLLFSSCFYCLNPADVGVANAQEPVLKNQSSSDIVVAQSTSPGTPSQPTPRRPRARFFEEGSRFGAGSFVQSALDGVNNTFASDSTGTSFDSESVAAETTGTSFASGSVAADTIQNITLPANPPLINNPGEPLSAIINGDITVSTRNLTNPSLLNLTFTSPGTNLTLSNPTPGANPRMGTVTVNGFITVNGQRIPFNNVTSNYSGRENLNINPTTNAVGTVSGTVQVSNPANPGTTFTINLPSTAVPRDIESRPSITAPNAQLTIGRPRGR